MEESTNSDIYKAPEAELETAENKTEFFIVSIKKLWIMNLITMGMYGVYWNYKHWRNYRYYGEVIAPIWPVWRAIFSVFFIGGLLRNIAQSYNGKVSDAWDPLASTALYVFMIVLNIVFAILGYGETKTGLIYQWLQIIFVPVCMTFAMVTAQQQANIACFQPNGDSNAKISGANILWIVLFIIYWLMVVLGSYVVFYGITEF